MATNLYENCILCPRNCHANRFDGNLGFCKNPSTIRAAKASLHMYEEPFISGTCGSGTIFFSGCSLGCIFCQNSDLSKDNLGYEINDERLAEIFLEQQERNAHNINLVTATHFTPSVAHALQLAKEGGLKIPVIWNSSGYEKVETLKMLEGLVDIYLPDFKTLSSDIAKRYFNAPDYPDFAKEALSFMVSSTSLFFEGDPDEDGLIKSGVVVRHLVMPGNTNDSKNVIKYLYETYGDRIWISLMNQYTPIERLVASGTFEHYPELKNTLFEKEYDEVVDFAIELGIENCLIQEGETISESFIPSFDGGGIIK